MSAKTSMTAASVSAFSAVKGARVYFADFDKREFSMHVGYMNDVTLTVEIRSEFGLFGVWEYEMFTSVTHCGVEIMTLRSVCDLDLGDEIPSRNIVFARIRKHVMDMTALLGIMAMKLGDEDLRGAGFGAWQYMKS